MSSTQYDALIIGGGPGGSSAATFLAQAGKRVLVLEKEHFPRFHIGESLLPYNRRIFEAMGVLPALEKAGFPVKYGAQFHLGNGKKHVKLVFRNGCFTRETAAFQVERSTFDDLLLKRARECGAEVREGWTAGSFRMGPAGIELEARSDSGQAERFSASFLIDASGRGNVTGNQERLRIAHPGFKKLAVFGHFENVEVDEGTASGDTIIVRLENKWFWIIPLGRKISVGCVIDPEEYSPLGKTPREVFERLVDGSTEMRRRMAEARPVNTIQVTSDFSYYNRRLVGARLLRVGDAAGFMDPIFSVGVYLAMHTGRMAATAVCDSLAAGDDGRRSFAAYEKRVFRMMQSYWLLVRRFYTRPFMELFFEPRPRFQVPDALVAILAGELEGGWAVEWRRRLFLLFVSLQARFELVPRLTFTEEPRR
jgi:FADH2-dependent halogenase